MRNEVTICNRNAVVPYGNLKAGSMFSSGNSVFMKTGIKPGEFYAAINLETGSTEWFSHLHEIIVLTPNTEVKLKVK